MAPPSNATDYDAKTIEGDGKEKLMDWEPPKAQGLYDPQNEHEACGVGFIVAIDGKRNHKVWLTELLWVLLAIIITRRVYSTSACLTKLIQCHDTFPIHKLFS